MGDTWVYVHGHRMLTESSMTGSPDVGPRNTRKFSVPNVRPTVERFTREQVIRLGGKSLLKSRVDIGQDEQARVRGAAVVAEDLGLDLAPR